MQLAPGGNLSEINAFRQRQSIVKVDTQVPYGTVHLCMTQEQRNRPEISGLLVDLRYLRAPHRMGAIGTWFQANGDNPFPHDPSILSGRKVRAREHPAGPKKI